MYCISKQFILCKLFVQVQMHILIVMLFYKMYLAILHFLYHGIKNKSLFLN